jgi:GTP-binding protein
VSGPKPLGRELALVPHGFPGRADFIKSATKLSQAPHHPLPEVCFCGRSNVGKSSLINSLTNRKQLARVSSTPGRTQLINFFNIQDRVVFADLPGYGWAKVPKQMKLAWGKTVQEYLHDRPQLTLAILLVDIRRDPREEEQNLLAWFAAQGRQCLIVATKADKVPASKLKGRLRGIAKDLEVKPSSVLPFSALSKQGRDVVWGAVLAATAPPAED